MRRPFTNKSWPELKAMADASWNDPTKLKFIAAELARRRKQAAHDVRARIERRFSRNPAGIPSLARDGHPARVEKSVSTPNRSAFFHGLPRRS